MCLIAGLLDSLRCSAQQVAHHLFSSMPHYHAREATSVLRPLLGEYYQCDARSPARALVMDWLRCSYVAPDPAPSGGPAAQGGAAARPGVFWYRTLPSSGVLKAAEE